tara:strand:- start:1611 stop:2288 length:678 start_codon:yes stop_codon:yes gene_type:complete
MSLQPKHYEEIFRQFQAPISKVYDCGKKCAHLNGGKPVCCSTDNAIPIVENTEWKLLKSRTDLWKPYKAVTADAKKELADLKGSDCCAIECKGVEYCERDNRSLACRSFPFYPYFNPAKELVGLATYWVFEGQCWVISNLTIVDKKFIKQFIQSHEYMFKHDEEWRGTYIDQSASHRRVYSRRGEKFAVVGTDGSYYWVLPKSGGKMVPATEAQLKKLRKGFVEK